MKGILGDRLELKANLLRVAKLEPEPTRAEKLRDLARQAADYLSQVDYDAYFDTLIPPSGKQEKEFTEFSLSALKESKKNLEAFLLLFTAFIVLLGQIYAGIWISDLLQLPTADQLVAAGEQDNAWYQFLSGLRLENLTQMILDVPQKAGNRAIMIGIALGIVSTSLKVLLGVDRSYLGSED